MADIVENNTDAGLSALLPIPQDDFMSFINSSLVVGMNIIIYTNKS